jgi:hypothetical protein
LSGGGGVLDLEQEAIISVQAMRGKNKFFIR